MRTPLIVAALAGACGGEPAHEQGPRTVVLMTVDDLRPDHLALYGYAKAGQPAISALAEGASVLDDAITPSTSRNAALATILTGLAPREHALAMGTVGRQRLAQRFDTLAELYAERDFRTIAAVSVRQLEARLCGLDQGFDVYLDGDLPGNGSALPAAELVHRVLPELEELGTREHLFLWLHFGDPRSDPAALQPEEAERIRSRLRPFAASDDDLARELAAADPVEPLLARLEQVVGRRRGGAAWRELREALYDVQVSRVDAALGTLLEELGRTRRRDDALVALVGTRGRYLTEDRPDGRVEGLSEGVLRVPWIVRSPGGHAGRSSWSRDPRTLFDELAPEPRVERHPLATSASPGLERVALCDAEWKAIWGPEAGAAPVWVRREDDEVTEEPPAVATDPPFAEGGESTPRLRLGLEALAGRETRWVFGLLVGGRVQGEVRWNGSRPDAEEWPVPRPDSPVVLRVQADEAMPREGTLLFEGTPVGEVPVPRLPDRDGEPWEPEEGAPEWVVDVARDGPWLAVVVDDEQRAGARALVFAAAYPPGDEERPLEDGADPSASRLSDPMLPDAVVLGGTLPFTARVRARPNSRLALFVTIDGAGVPVERMRYLGRRFAADAVTLFFPPWLPERMDWFTGLEFVPPESGSGEAWATISLQRRPGAYLMEGPIDLSPEEARFLKRMAASE